MLFIHSGTDIAKAFGVELISSPEMSSALTNWDRISTGKPPWLNAEDEIGTINMAKHISDTRAKLVTLDIGIAISGSPRADYLQGLADDLLKRLPDRVSEAERLGGIMLKWNGETWDFILPGNFGITAKDDNGEIVGAIFAAHTAQGSRHFTRLEYHRFEGSTAEGGKLYKITNKAFENRLSTKGEVTLGEEVALDKVDAWAHLAPEVTITNLAISRKNTEIEDSKHITFVGQQLIQNAQNRNVELPRFVKGLGMGLSDGEVSAIHEHAPTLLTDARIKDINFDLSMAGVKCGFSEGVFVLDGQTGMITATQVEADDRDTIQTIKTDRDALKDAITQALAGADALVTLYNLAPLGEYEVNFNFGDVTYNYEEDKASWRAYVMQGWVPKWMYFVKFEGMSEEEAKAMTAEADAAQIEKAQLFGAE